MFAEEFKGPNFGGCGTYLTLTNSIDESILGVVGDVSFIHFLQFIFRLEYGKIGAFSDDV